MMMVGFVCAAVAAGVGPNPNTLRKTPRRKRIDCRFIVILVAHSIRIGRRQSNHRKPCFKPKIRVRQTDSPVFRLHRVKGSRYEVRDGSGRREARRGCEWRFSPAWQSQAGGWMRTGNVFDSQKSRDFVVGCPLSRASEGVW